MSRRGASRAEPVAPEGVAAAQPIPEFLRALAEDASETLARMRRDAAHLGELKARAGSAFTAIGGAVKDGLEEELEHFADRLRMRMGGGR